MLLRTYEQCIKAVDSALVYVATDDDRIVQHCNQFGMQVLLTSESCLTGTDRIAEVAEQIKATYYINVQGDEPVFDPNDIITIIKALKEYPGEILNGYCQITDEEQYTSVYVPKVVFKPDGQLLYMSRSAIPGNKERCFVKAWRQVCIYAFPYQSLVEFAATTAKTPLEEQEDIEILRFIELGFNVRMLPLSTTSIAVDTPGDVIKVLKRLQQDV
jgi:3-deoxy-manno-octulosonate cytidylyltransferase (CMP-KDO synthetase)